MAIGIRRRIINFAKEKIRLAAKLLLLGLAMLLSYLLFIFVISMKLNTAVVGTYIVSLVIICIVLFGFIFRQLISQRPFEEGVMDTPIVNWFFILIFFIFLTILFFGSIYTVSSECATPDIDCGDIDDFGKLIELDKKLDNYRDIAEQSPIEYKYDALYFSGVTFFNLGYGDIVPVGNRIRLTAVVEAGLGFLTSALLIGAAVSVLVKPFTKK